MNSDTLQIKIELEDSNKVNIIFTPLETKCIDNELVHLSSEPKQYHIVSSEPTGNTLIKVINNCNMFINYLVDVLKFTKDEYDKSFEEFKNILEEIMDVKK